MKRSDSVLNVCSAMALAVSVLGAASTQASELRWTAQFNSGGANVAASNGRAPTPLRTGAALPPAATLPPAAKLPPAPVLPQTGTRAPGGTTFSFFQFGSSVFWRLAYGF